MHLLHVYTGDGKGKTTAAMGLALRALGHGRKVLVAQFLKDGRSGELSPLSAIPGCTVFRGEGVQGFASLMDEAARAEVLRRECVQAAALTDLIGRTSPDMVVLDELATAAGMACLSRSAAKALLDAALACAETVVTGRGAPDWLLDRADYLTQCVCLRHPYQRGVSAREGVEW